MARHFLVLIKEAAEKVKDAAAFAFKASRPVRAEFTAARHPERTESLTEDTFEAPLRRLQSPTANQSIADVAQRILAWAVLTSQLTDVGARQLYGSQGCCHR
jgi:hypothetical protein